MTPTYLIYFRDRVEPVKSSISFIKSLQTKSIQNSERVFMVEDDTLGRIHAIDLNQVIAIVPDLSQED